MWHSKSFIFLSICRSLVIFSNSQRFLKTLSLSNFSQAIPISPLSPVLFYRKITYYTKIPVCVVMVIQSQNSLNEKQVLKRLQVISICFLQQGYWLDVFSSTQSTKICSIHFLQKSYWKFMTSHHKNARKLFNTSIFTIY